MNHEGGWGLWNSGNQDTGTGNRLGTEATEAEENTEKASDREVLRRKAGRGQTPQ